MKWSKSVLVYVFALLLTSNVQAKDFYIGSLTEFTNAFHSVSDSRMTMGTGGTLGFSAYGANMAADVLNMGEHRFAARAAFNLVRIGGSISACSLSQVI